MLTKASKSARSTHAETLVSGESTNCKNFQQCCGRPFGMHGNAAQHPHRLHWISAYTSPRANHERAKHEKVRTHTGLGMTAVMRLRSRGALCLKRGFPITKAVISDCDPPRPSWPPSATRPMADQAPKKDTPYGSASTRGVDGEGKAEDGESKKPVPPPPPPEKPLAGDCCGSGCVRCVWDVYYEELEAYNKLYKTQ